MVITLAPTEASEVVSASYALQMLNGGCLPASLAGMRTKSLGWVWAASLVVLLARAAAQPSATVDAGLLLVFKGSFVNGGEVLSNWRGANPCDGWLGVSCSSDGQVTGL